MASKRCRMPSVTFMRAVRALSPSPLRYTVSSRSLPSSSFHTEENQMHTTCADVQKTTMTRRRSSDYSLPKLQPWRMQSEQHEEAEEEGGEGEEEGEETGAHRAMAEMIFGIVFSRPMNTCKRRCIFVEVAAAVPPSSLEDKPETGAV